MAINVTVNAQDTTNIQTYYGTVGTSATTVIASLAAAAGAIATQTGLRQHLQIHSPSASASVAYTLDGTAPVINGQGLTLTSTNPTSLYNIKVPQGAITLIGSGASTPYTIVVM